MSGEVIVYFSRSGENYVNGSVQNLSVGNTEIAAKIIQRITGGDLLKIEPVMSYSADYYECIDQAKQDLKKHVRPELKNCPQNLDQYEVVYLGYPNYWGTMPVAVFSFLEKCNLKGKRIRPFCTHEGSGMGRSESDLKEVCPQAIVEQGLAICGHEVMQQRKNIEAWI